MVGNSRQARSSLHLACHSVRFALPSRPGIYTDAHRYSFASRYVISLLPRILKAIDRRKRLATQPLSEWSLSSGANTCGESRGRTYNRPTGKSPDIPIFRARGSCRPQMVCKGSKKVAKSVIVLPTELNKNTAPILMHCPGIDGVQIFWRGMH